MTYPVWPICTRSNALKSIQRYNILNLCQKIIKNLKRSKNIAGSMIFSSDLWNGLQLPGLVKHLPYWVTPDHLTFFGFASALLIGVSYYLTSFDKNFLWLANLGFLFNWFGDSLDGNLARYRKIERPSYGFFIDHTIDTISEVSIFIGLGLSPYVDLNLAFLALVGYLCMANLVYITTSVKGVFKISYGSLGPTEVRVIAILSNIAVYFSAIPRSNCQVFLFPFIT